MSLKTPAYKRVQQIELYDDHHEIEMGKAVAQEQMPYHIRQDQVGILQAVEIIMQDQAVEDGPDNIR